MDVHKNCSELKLDQADKSSREEGEGLNLRRPLSGILEIGHLVITPPMILAPMSGITDWPMRLICREHGAPLAFTEMVAAAAVARKKLNPDTLNALKTHPDDRPLVIQIFGPDPDEMAEAARILAVEADAIDINMGCPVRKVVKNGGGAALMRDLKKAASLVRSVRMATSLALTVKTRTGWDESSRNAAELARVCEDEGADAIIIHGRTKARGFAGPPDLDAIREVVKAVNVPVIGNGGISGLSDAQAMINQTGCAGVMVARGARGNPWIFRELKDGPAHAAPSPWEKAHVMLRHLDMMLDFMPGQRAALEMRKHLPWYSKGIPGAVDLRRELQKVGTVEQIKDLVHKYFPGQEQ